MTIKRVFTMYLTIGLSLVLIMGCLTLSIGSCSKQTQAPAQPANAVSERIPAETTYRQTVYEAGVTLVEAEQALNLRKIEIENQRVEADWRTYQQALELQKQAAIAAARNEQTHQQNLNWVQEQLWFYLGSAGILLLTLAATAAIIFLVGFGWQYTGRWIAKPELEHRAMKRQLAQTAERIENLNNLLANHMLQSNLAPILIEEKPIEWRVPEELSTMAIGKKRNGQPIKTIAA